MLTDTMEVRITRSIHAHYCAQLRILSGIHSQIADTLNKRRLSEARHDNDDFIPETPEICDLLALARQHSLHSQNPNPHLP